MHRIRMTIYAGLTYLLLAPSSPTQAAVIYDEAIDGDLPNDRLLARLIPLPPITEGDPFKAWSVVGAVGTPADPADAWEVEVPFGHRIRNIKLGAELAEDAPPLRFRLFKIVDRSLQAGYNLDPPRTILLTTDLATTPPDQGEPFNPSSFGEGRHGMEFKSADDPPYVVHIELELVPEPATLGMLLLGGLMFIPHRAR